MPTADVELTGREPLIAGLPPATSGLEPELPGLRPPLVVYLHFEPAMLGLARLILTRRNLCRTAEFTYTRDALDYCRRTRPALLLTGSSFPEIDGYKFIQRIRADPALHDLPILVVTGGSISDDAARQLNASRMLLPFSPAELVDAVCAALSMSPPPGAARFSR